MCVPRFTPFFKATTVVSSKFHYLHFFAVIDIRIHTYVSPCFKEELKGFFLLFLCPLFIAMFLTYIE